MVAATYLKSTGALDSGTLAGGPSAYVYDDFADWWADSITAWSGYGVDIDYVSIQNEPDWNGNDRCLFDPTENSTNAGYDEALRPFGRNLTPAGARLCRKCSGLKQAVFMARPATA